MTLVLNLFFRCTEGTFYQHNMSIWPPQFIIIVHSNQQWDIWKLTLHKSMRSSSDPLKSRETLHSFWRMGDSIQVHFPENFRFISIAVVHVVLFVGEILRGKILRVHLSCIISKQAYWLLAGSSFQVYWGAEAWYVELLEKFCCWSHSGTKWHVLCWVLQGWELTFCLAQSEYETFWIIFSTELSWIVTINKSNKRLGLWQWSYPV